MQTLRVWLILNDPVIQGPWTYLVMRGGQEACLGAGMVSVGATDGGRKE